MSRRSVKKKKKKIRVWNKSLDRKKYGEMEEGGSGKTCLSEIHNNRCVRKLTGMVDAFLREACDRIETHDQYEILRIYQYVYVRRKVHWGRKKETCHRNAFRAASSTCVLIEYRIIIGCMFNGYRVYTLQETRAIYRIDNVILIVWKKKDSGRNTLYTKSRESTSVLSKPTYRSFSGLVQQRNS